MLKTSLENAECNLATADAMQNYQGGGPYLAGQALEI
jgi:hypothetical protein